MDKVVSFPSLLIMVLFIQVGMVSFNALLDVDLPLVEFAVNIEDVTMDGTFLRAEDCREFEIPILSFRLLFC